MIEAPLINGDQLGGSEVSARLEHYRSTAMNQIVGWLGEKVIHALDLVCEFQRVNAVRGDAIEIGVYQGRFFVALMAAIESNEIAIAADIFDDMRLNIDGSGFGIDTFSIFNANVKKYARNSEALRICQGDSMVLRPQELLSLSPQNGFRLISVDGGHTAEHVMNDLTLAASIINGGGVVFLDDFHSPHWPGVHEGYVRYMTNLNRNLAPALYVDNKLLLTTVAYHRPLVDLFKARFSTWPSQEIRMVKSFGFDYAASA